MTESTREWVKGSLAGWLMFALMGIISFTVRESQNEMKVISTRMSGGEVRLSVVEEQNKFNERALLFQQSTNEKLVTEVRELSKQIAILSEKINAKK